MSDNMLETLTSTVAGIKPTRGVSVQVEGNNNVVGSNVDKIENIFNTQVVIRDSAGKRQRIDISFDRERYNLFVLDEKIFEYDHFIVPLDAVFSEGTEDALRDKFLPLTDEKKDKLKRYPAVFVPVNKDFGAKANSDDVILFGKIRDITVQENGVFVEFFETGDVDKGELYALSELLGLGKPRAIPEFKYVHWAVKNIDIIAVLESVGKRFC